MQLLNTHQNVMNPLPNALLLPENSNFLPIPLEHMKMIKLLV